MKILNWIKKVLRIKQTLPNSWDRNSEKIYPNDAIFDEILGSDEDLTGFASFDWRPYKPLLEIQAFGDCVAFSRLNVAEIKAVFEKIRDEEGKEINFSDLFLAVKSGTSKTGNSLRNVAEEGRKNGVVMEKYCPYTYVWEERLSRVNSVSSDIKRHKLGNWAWVSTPNNFLKQALQKSPVQIGIGVGNNYNTDEIIKDPKIYFAYHAVTLLYMDEFDRKYIYDHYDKSEKTLAADYSIIFAMTFLDLPKNWRGMGVDDVRFYNRMIGKLIILPENAGEVYRIYENYIQKVKFVITDKSLWDIIQIALREKKAFLGVSNKDFERLKKIAFTLEGIKTEEEELDVNSILEDI